MENYVINALSITSTDLYHLNDTQSNNLLLHCSVENELLLDNSGLELLAGECVIISIVCINFGYYDCHRNANMRATIFMYQIRRDYMQMVMRNSATATIFVNTVQLKMNRLSRTVDWSCWLVSL